MPNPSQSPKDPPTCSNWNQFYLSVGFKMFSNSHIWQEATERRCHHPRCCHLHSIISCWQIVSAWSLKSITNKTTQEHKLVFDLSVFLLLRTLRNLLLYFVHHACCSIRRTIGRARRPYQDASVSRRDKPDQMEATAMGERVIRRLLLSLSPISSLVPSLFSNHMLSNVLLPVI